MENLIRFVNTFLSYIVLMLIILAVGGVGIAIGLLLRKRKNAALAAQTPAAEEKTETKEGVGAGE